MHPDPTCLALAERRRAFGRALRVAGVPDTGSRPTEYVRKARPSRNNRWWEQPTPDQQGRTTDMSTR